MKIRESVRNFNPYSPGTVDAEIRMDKNESPFSLPGELKHKIRTELENITVNRYPPSSGDRLREKLAEFHGLKKANVIVGSGSDQLISYSAGVFAGEYAVVTPPTFSMYRFYAKLNGLGVEPVPLAENFNLRMEELEEVLNKAAVVFLCSPNNPTGNVFDRGKLIKILETGVPVVLDEAYGEFADGSNMDLIESYGNLLVLRTFSKAFGLAGARVGYALGQAGTVEHLLRVKPPYNLNSFSLRIAELLLENYDLIRDRVNFLIDQREKLYSKFKHYSYSSKTNFLLMDLDADDYLLERGIAVRSFTGRLAEHIRVTVGTEEENDRFIRALRSYIHSTPESKKRVDHFKGDDQ
ncbi:histidinol-phosphate transaminase [Candidatus Bipolaricaulota bacterium]|nr:histidinol-phosphate transaminase [Candidatus Bipolaricaulota bacterium]